MFLCDLGIAKVKQLGALTMTCANKGCGTYPYMAPEMFKSSRRGTGVDIYSLGCLYIELFGRKRIWGELDGPEIMLKLLGSYENPPVGPNISHLKPNVQSICSSLCALDATKRPTSTDVLRMVKDLRTQN